MQPVAKPIYTPAGDNHLVIYYSEETNVATTMMVLSYRSAILQSKIPGVVEVENGECSLMVHFDPAKIHFPDLLREIKQIEEYYASPEKWASLSRLIEIPVLFDDPWSLECYLKHKALHQDKNGSMSNLLFCAKLNEMTKDQFIQKLTSPQSSVWLLFVFRRNFNKPSTRYFSSVTPN